MAHRYIYFAICTLLGLIATIPNAIAGEPQLQQLGFVENRGQLKNQHGEVNHHVQYLWQSGGNMNVQLRKDGISYDTYVHQAGGSRFHRLDMRLIGSNPDAFTHAAEAIDGHINYYKPQQYDSHITDLQPFGKITYSEIYPGIDLVCVIDQSQNQAHFKYDFVVKPGGDPTQIQMEYTGYNHARLGETELGFQLTQCLLEESIPLSYLSPGYQEVQAQYCSLDGKSGESGRLMVGIELHQSAENRQGRDLVIDPVAKLEWSTYYGGESEDVVQAVAIDSLGILFIAGSTRSTSTMASEGSHQGSFAGGDYDAFIARFNQHGLRQWASYYGGSGDDHAQGIALNNFEHLYLVGHSNSVDSIGSTQSWQAQNAGGYDGFVARFSRDGHLLWDTFVGGSADDEIKSCAVRDDGDLYVAGVTHSSSFLGNDSIPLTIIGNPAGGADAFAMRFTQDGAASHLHYFGGGGYDAATSLSFGPDSLLYMAGYTTSANGIVDGMLLEGNYGGGEDGFVAVMHPNLQLHKSGYFGGDGNQRITGITADTLQIYFTGHTDSPLAFADTSSQQMDFGGSTDAFITAIDATHQLAWFSYIGGDSSDVGMGISLDRDGEVYVVGTTHSSTHMDDADSVATTAYQGNGDAFVARFDSEGHKIWGRYYGGEASEEGLALAAFGYTAIFFGGSTQSPDSMGATNGTYSELHQEVYGGEGDGFLARLTQTKSTPPSFCTPGNNGGWAGNGSGWGDYDYNNPPGLGLCIGDSMQLSVAGGCLGDGAEWIWYIDECGETDLYIGEGESIWVAPVVTTTYHVRAESVDHISTCTKATVNVDLPPTATASAIPDSACAGSAVQLQADGGVHYLWQGPNDLESQEQNLLLDSIAPVQAGIYTVMVATLYWCIDTTEVDIVVLPAPQFNLSGTNISCLGFADGTATVSPVDSTEMNFYWPHAATSATYFDNLPAGTYSVTATDANNCSASASIVLTEPPHPLDSVSVIPAYCDEKDGAITLFLNAETAPHEVDWSPGPMTGPEVLNIPGGSYSATITDANGCTFLVDVEVPNLGFFEVSISPDSLYLELGQSAELSVWISPSTPNLTYLWQPAAGLSCSDCSSPIANPDTSTTYTALVTSDRGCTASDTLFVEREPVLSIPFMPTIFSPNGDGLNDELCVLGDRIVQLQLQIFNRRGDMVFDAKEPSQCWDGTYKGAPVANGAYVYHLQLALDDGEVHVKSGNLSVIR